MTEIKRKFNVGDKVRIIKDDVVNASPYGVCVGDIVEVIGYKHDDACIWDEDDCKYRPVITTSLDSDNRYRSFFEESALELVEKANVVPSTKEKNKTGGIKMNKLVELNNEQVVTTSLVVAEVFGKEHKHVMRDIRGLLKDVSRNEPMFFEGNSPDSYGRDRKIYYINRDGFTLLAMGFTGKKALQFKLDYIQAFNAMEKELKEKQPNLSTKDLLIRASLEHEHRLEKLETKVQEVFDDAPINYVQQKRLEDVRKQRVIEVLGGYDSNAYKQMARKVFAACSRDVKKLFTIPRYNELSKRDYDKAMQFIAEWQPDALTKHHIQTLNQQGYLKMSQGGVEE